MRTLSITLVVFIGTVVGCSSSSYVDINAYVLEDPEYGRACSMGDPCGTLTVCYKEICEDACVAAGEMIYWARVSWCYDTNNTTDTDCDCITDLSKKCGPDNVEKCTKEVAEDWSKNFYFTMEDWIGYIGLSV